MLVADINTMAAAGNAVLDAFRQADDITVSKHIFKDEHLVPNEAALDQLREAAKQHPGSELWLSVGSGTINDLTRYVSFEAGKPFMAYATAPSMDGYASGVSPLILNQMKQTFNAHSPLAIVADPVVLAQAPAPMIQAGAGDVFGKYTSILDWQLTALLFDEYYCPEIVAMVERSREAVRAAIPGIRDRDPEAISLLFNALIEVGIAMDYSGNSRPASGAEHHLAHFWEMRFLFDNKLPVLHGLKVGVALPIILDVYSKLPSTIDFGKTRSAINSFSLAAWSRATDTAYGPAAGPIKDLAENEDLHSAEKRLARIDAIEAKWPQVLELVRSAPSSSEIQALYSVLDFPASPAALDVSSEEVALALKHAKDLRSRYTILRLYEDLDLEVTR